MARDLFASSVSTGGALALAGLIVLAYELERRYPWPREPKVALTFCAWCIQRDGETCGHPDSPVAGESCGPVCIGRLHCEVREVEKWGRRCGDGTR